MTFRPGDRVIDRDNDSGTVLAAKKGGRAIYVERDDGVVTRYHPDDLRVLRHPDPDDDSVDSPT